MIADPSYGSAEFRDLAAPPSRRPAVTYLDPHDPDVAAFRAAAAPIVPTAAEWLAARVQVEARHAVAGGWLIRRTYECTTLHKGVTLEEVADYITDLAVMGYEAVVKTDLRDPTRLVVWQRPVALATWDETVLAQYREALGSEGEDAS